MNIDNRKTSSLPYQYYCFLVIMLWNSGSLVAFVRSFLLRMPIIGDPTLVNIFIIGSIYVLLTILAFPYMKTKIRTIDYGLYIIFCFIYFVEALSIDSNSDYLVSKAWIILLRCVTLYFVGVCINTKDYQLIDILHKTSLISVFVEILFLFAVGTGRLTEGADNMDLAYRIIPHICMVIYYAVTKTNIIGIAGTIIGFIMLFIFGNRGCFVISGAFLILCIFILKRHKHKIIFLLSSSFLLYYISTQYINLLLELSVLFSRYGLRTRIFDRILGESLFISQDRDNLKLYILDAIAQRKWFGYGIAGDRIILGGESYSHNILLELWVSYGYPIGTIIFSVILFFLLRTVLTPKISEIRVLVLVLIFGNGFLKLFMSSSYLIEPQFFLLIGICVCIRREYPIHLANLKMNIVNSNAYEN